jgi:hypothetical protein
MQAISLRLSGLTYREIGKSLGITPQGAQSLVKPAAPIYNFVKDKTNGKCAKCGVAIDNGNVHHKVSEGITQKEYDSIENLEYLCISCHQHEHHGYAAPKLVSYDKGGRPEVLTPCPFCGKLLGARQLRAHFPKCPKRGKVAP